MNLNYDILHDEQDLVLLFHHDTPLEDAEIIIANDGPMTLVSKRSTRAMAPCSSKIMDRIRANKELICVRTGQHSQATQSFLVPVRIGV